MVVTIIYYILSALCIGAIILAIKKIKEYETMLIKNKTLFILALSLLSVGMILNVRFPDEAPYGEVLVTVLHIPLRFAGGLHTVGITVLILLIGALIMLTQSLKKYYGRSVLIAVVGFALLPAIAVYLFQHTLATGVYALAYTSEEAHCNFEMTDKETLHGECALPFENHSHKAVDFQVEFHEVLTFEDDLPMMSLMNADGPFDVTLEGHEGGTVHLEADLDVSEMEQHIEGGNATGVNIIIEANGKKRKL